MKEGNSVKFFQQTSDGVISRVIDEKTVEVKTADGNLLTLPAEQIIPGSVGIEKRRQSVLYAVTTALAGSKTLDEAMENMLHSVCSGLGWQWSAIWTIDPVEEVLRCSKNYSNTSGLEEFRILTEKTTFKKGEGLIGRVWQEEQAAWVTDVQQYAGFKRVIAAKEVDLHTALCFPVLSAEGMVGVMEFFTIHPEDPDNSLLALMHAIGGQMGQFIGRTHELYLSENKLRELEDLYRRLEDDMTRRVEDDRRMNAQHAATRVLAESTDLLVATPKLLREICKGLNWQCSMMWAVDEELDQLRFVDCWQDEGDFTDFIEMSRGMGFVLGRGLPGRVWETAKPLWILDVVKDTNFPRAKTAEKGDLHGAFAFPVCMQDRVLGVMEFFSTHVQEPDEALLAMMAAVGSQIGQFIERKNAESKLVGYLQELKEQKTEVERNFLKNQEDSLRLRAQHAATKVLADAPDLSAATPLLLKSICEGLNWQCSMMWAVDEKQGQLHFVDCWHAGEGDFSDFIEMSRAMGFTRGRGLPGRVWDTAKPLWILDVVKDPNFPRAKTAEKGNLHGAFAFPVCLQERVLGVMEFFSTHVQEPDEALLAMMAAVGSQIGQFIERKSAEQRAAAYLMEVENQKAQVEEHQKEIIDSINYAKRIQRALLASDERLRSNFRQHFVFFQPKDIVSGDFYWAAELENDEVVLVTADSTGHGVPGAIMSMLNISCLNEAVEGKKLIAPRDILNYTRSRIIHHLANDGSAEGGKDGMDCSLLSFNFEKKELTYSAANNPVWIVRNDQLLEFDPDKMPVGKHDRDSVSFSQQTIAMQEKDMVYTFTDGMPDQFGGPKGKKFMYKQLKELLLNICHLDMKEQKERLGTALNKWKEGLEQVDDVTIIGIRM
jgi:serine phosphatase RsbU (regulator of sigma subunit)/putative methionine-R-sulfoxide reductase with GAF domain